MKRKRLIIDASSILWAALFAGEDKENGFNDFTDEGKSVYVNSWQFGLNNALNSWAAVMRDLDFVPRDTILVLDGNNGKMYRAAQMREYKGTRDKSPGQTMQYEELQRRFVEILKRHGGNVVSHWNWEADDVMVALAQQLQPDTAVIWSRDKDLLAAADEPKIFVYDGKDLNPDKFDGLPFEFIDLYKATVGDPSDNIPGAKGFGPKAFMKVWEQFGADGMRELRRLISKKRLIEIQEDVATLPALQKLLDFEHQVHKSWKVACLYPEKVPMDELVWEWGMNAMGETGKEVPQLSEFVQKGRVVNAENAQAVYAEVLQWAKDNPESIITLDIETSSSDESDEWVAENSEKNKRFVDQFGAELTGFSLTWGRNDENTIYVDVDHLGRLHVPKAWTVEFFKELNKLVRFSAHNAYFENTVLRGYLGFWFNDVDDTMLMAAYVNENTNHGLKYLSKTMLRYTQTSYEEVTQGLKMNQLTVDQVTGYGMDDTIVTAALRNVFETLLRLERSYDVYRQVEIGSLMMKCQAFHDGISISMQNLSEMSQRDQREKEEWTKKFNSHLIDMKWEGTELVELTYGNYKEPSMIKYWVNIIVGAGDNVWSTRRRKFEAILLELEEHQTPEVRTFGRMLKDFDTQTNMPIEAMNQFLERFFTGNPKFNTSSPTQVQHLLYKVLEVPVRIRNPTTNTQRKAGMKGTPKTDALAIQTALVNDVEPGSKVEDMLKALARIKSLETRFTLFYNKYYTAPHWKDGKLHSFIRQSSTNTRRDTSSKTNLQQLPKGKKGDLRRIIMPHHKYALVVSLDFAAQELRVIADYGRDPNLVACYVGENKVDMHSLTASKMMGVSYESFREKYSDESHPEHKAYSDTRKLAKIVNFSSEYGVQAPTMAIQLMSTEAEAQRYLDAKFETFAGSEAWKRQVIVEAREAGYVTTKLGARRHLKAELTSSNKWERMKAERQAVNFKIQGSSAEMTKLALGRMWRAKLTERYDMHFYAPIHDEVVFSVAISDLPKAVEELHALMVGNYADMWIPIESSISMGPNFGDQHEMGDVPPTAENIEKFMNSVLEKEAGKAA